MREVATAPQEEAGLVEMFDRLIVDAYGLAIAQVQSVRRAEQITNRVVDRLADVVRRSPTIDEDGLRSAAYRAMHRELTAHGRRLHQSRRLNGLRAGMRHFVLAGSASVAVGYALVMGVF